MVPRSIPEIDEGPVRAGAHRGRRRHFKMTAAAGGPRPPGEIYRGGASSCVIVPGPVPCPDESTARVVARRRGFFAEWSDGDVAPSHELQSAAETGQESGESDPPAPSRMPRSTGSMRRCRTVHGRWSATARCGWRPSGTTPRGCCAATPSRRHRRPSSGVSGDRLGGDRWSSSRYSSAVQGRRVST
jgi:hypothetical protein